MTMMSLLSQHRSNHDLKIEIEKKILPLNLYSREKIEIMNFPISFIVNSSPVD